MSDKLKKIKNLMKKFNKDDPDNPIMEFASNIKGKYKYLSTPFPELNKLSLLPQGRFTTIAGPSQVGKSALIMQIIAHNQALDPEFVAIWQDLEHAWDAKWARTLGMDLDRVILVQYTDSAKNMEKVFDNTILLLRDRIADICVTDSIGAMVPKADLEDKKGDRSLEKSNMLNLQTKLGEIYRKLNIIIAPKKGFRGTAMVMLGHVYQVPSDQGYDITAVRGGNAVKHWAHIRWNMRKGPQKDWPEKIDIEGLDGKIRKVFPGFSSRIQLDKTKDNALEGQEIVLTFFKGRGFDDRISTVSAALGMKIIDRRGGWYYNELFPDGKIQSREALDKLLLENEEIYESVKHQIDKQFILNEEKTDEFEHK